MAKSKEKLTYVYNHRIIISPNGVYSKAWFIYISNYNLIYLLKVKIKSLNFYKFNQEKFKILTLFIFH